MEFTLENIGPIPYAEIQMNGITVLAGENSTGKSTIEKAVYLGLASLYNLPDYVQTDRIQTLVGEFQKQGIKLDNIFKNISNAKRRHKVSQVSDLQGKFAVAMALQVPISKDDLQDMIDQYAERHGRYYGLQKEQFCSLDQYKYWKETMTSEILKDMAQTDDDIGKGSILEFIKVIFSGQIVHFGSEDQKSCIKLEEHGASSQINFQHQSKNARDICSSLTSDLALTQSVSYFDSPNVFDDIGYGNNDHIGRTIRGLLMPGGRKLVFARKSIYNAVSAPSNENQEENTTIKQNYSQEFVDDFNEMINSVVHGELKITSARRIQFVPDHSNRAVEMDNVSTGIKSLANLAFAMKNGAIEDDSYILLDEPEINLHPEWQIKYAEILVRMVAKTNVKVMITTHSPYFLHALEVYSARDGIVDRCHYYLTKNTLKGSDVENITGEVEKAYKLLAQPFQTLEDETEYE